MRLLNRATTRGAEEIANDLGHLVEEGQALLGEMMKRPAAKTVALRDALEMASDKLASYLSLSDGNGAAGSPPRDEVRTPDRSVRACESLARCRRRNRVGHPRFGAVESAPLMRSVLARSL